MQFHCSPAKLNEGYVAWHSILLMLYFKQYASAKAFELISPAVFKCQHQRCQQIFQAETGLQMERQLRWRTTNLAKQYLRLVLVAVEIQLAKCSTFFSEQKELQHNVFFFNTKSSYHKYPLTSWLAMMGDIFLLYFPKQMGKSLSSRVN